MSAVILSDEIVHYEVLGRGRPLFFLHGWVGSWRYWIPTMQSASISFRTYALDFWGFGDSAKNPYFYSIDQQVNMLDQFLNEMGIGKIAVIGHGLGAIVGLLFASRFPKVVDRIMAVSLPSKDHLLNPRLYTASPGELADWLLGRTALTDAARAEAPKADPRAIQHSLSFLQTTDPSGIFWKLETPSLLVYGQNDPAIEVPAGDNGASMPEHVHQIIFDQSGHFPMLDESNKFNRLMADFLSLTSGISPRQLQLKEEWKRRVR